MTYEAEKKQLLEYARNKNIEDLTSEDIMKLIDVPYIIEDITEAFNISKKEFDNIRKKYGIKNIYTESIYRDLVSILYYVNYKYPHFNKEKLKDFINLLLISITSSLPKGDYYKRELTKVDWLSFNYKDIIIEKNIDLNYRLNKKLLATLEYVDKLAWKDKEEQTQNYIQHLQVEYNKLIKEKENGKTFSKENLTYEILYQLSIIEAVNDEMIGNIFELSKKEVTYIRKKHGLENAFAKRYINHPEFFRQFLIKKGIYTANISDFQLLMGAYGYCLEQTVKKNWNFDTINKYYEEKLREFDDLETICTSCNNNNDDYQVTTRNYIYEEFKPSEKKKFINGHEVNQLEVNKIKSDAGTLGEEIIYNDEIKKLMKLKLYDLIDDVQWVTKTKNKNKTLDGLGYDIISYNEKREKIYIEVKCSTTNNPEKMNFNISNKEVEFMNGNIPGIDKDHCFIYYLFNIDKEKKTADKFIINNKLFSTLNLIPTNYKVTGNLVIDK